MTKRIKPSILFALALGANLATASYAAGHGGLTIAVARTATSYARAPAHAPRVFGGTKISCVGNKR